MSQLRTYIDPSGHHILSLDSIEHVKWLKPGALVRHGHFPGTEGLLIAIDEEQMSVLWSIEPKGMPDLSDVMSKEISDEIDAQIMKDLISSLNVKLAKGIVK